MNFEILKHLSYLLDIDIAIGDKVEVSKQIVEDYFDLFYDEKTIEESNKMFRRYQQITKKDKFCLYNDLQKLDIPTDIFDFQEFQENIKQVNENSSRINELVIFFKIFQSETIKLNTNDDDIDLDSDNPDISTLVQQFNFFQDLS